MRIQFNDLEQFMTEHPEYIFNDRFGHFNTWWGEMDSFSDPWEVEELKKVKRLYGFMLTLDSKTGKFRGNKVCRFFIDKSNNSATNNPEFDIYTLTTSDELNTAYRGKGLYIKGIDGFLEPHWLNALYLFTTKEEADAAIVTRRAELQNEKIEMRKQYLQEQIRIHEEEINKYRRELENLN